MEDTIFRGGFLSVQAPTQDVNLLSVAGVKLHVCWGQCDRAEEG